MAITPVPDPIEVPDAPNRATQSQEDFSNSMSAMLSALAGIVAWMRTVALSAWNNATSAAADALATAADRVQTGQDRTAAAASAASALNAPGTSATSVTPMVVDGTTKNFTVQTAKSFQNGSWFSLTDANDIRNQMIGQITYNPANGAVVMTPFSFRAVTGAAIASWILAPTASPAVNQGAGLPVAAITAAGPTLLSAGQTVIVRPNANDVTTQCPANPAQGHQVGVEIDSLTAPFKAVIDGNGQKIGGLLEPLNIRQTNVGVLLEYRGDSWSVQPYGIKQ